MIKIIFVMTDYLFFFLGLEIIKEAISLAGCPIPPN
jgi:hypothetical protein